MALDKTLPGLGLGCGQNLIPRSHSGGQGKDSVLLPGYNLISLSPLHPVGEMTFLYCHPSLSQNAFGYVGEAGVTGFLANKDIKLLPHCVHRHWGHP